MEPGTMVDFFALGRRDLQTLCKRNRIPANTTNLAMAGALRALPSVEGLEEFLESLKYQSPKKTSGTAPEPPTTGRRTSARLKTVKEVSELAPSTTARTRRGVATGKTSTVKSKAAEQESEEGQGLLETPLDRGSPLPRSRRISLRTLDIERLAADDEENDTEKNVPETPPAVASAKKSDVMEEPRKVVVERLPETSLTRQKGAHSTLEDDTIKNVPETPSAAAAANKANVKEEPQETVAKRPPRTPSIHQKGARSTVKEEEKVMSSRATARRTTTRQSSRKELEEGSESGLSVPVRRSARLRATVKMASLLVEEQEDGQENEMKESLKNNSESVSDFVASANMEASSVTEDCKTKVVGDAEGPERDTVTHDGQLVDEEIDVEGLKLYGNQHEKGDILLETKESFKEDSGLSSDVITSADIDDSSVTEDCKEENIGDLQSRDFPCKPDGDAEIYQGERLVYQEIHGTAAEFQQEKDIIMEDRLEEDQVNVEQREEMALGDSEDSPIKGLVESLALSTEGNCCLQADQDTLHPTSNFLASEGIFKKGKILLTENCERSEFTLVQTDLKGDDFSNDHALDEGQDVPECAQESPMSTHDAPLTMTVTNLAEMVPDTTQKVEFSCNGDSTSLEAITGKMEIVASMETECQHALQVDREAPEPLSDDALVTGDATENGNFVSDVTEKAELESAESISLKAVIGKLEAMRVDEESDVRFTTAASEEKTIAEVLFQIVEAMPEEDRSSNNAVSCDNPMETSENAVPEAACDSISQDIPNNTNDTPVSFHVLGATQKQKYDYNLESQSAKASIANLEANGFADTEISFSSLARDDGMVANELFTTMDIVLNVSTADEAKMPDEETVPQTYQKTPELMMPDGSETKDDAIADMKQKADSQLHHFAENDKTNGDALSDENNELLGVEMQVDLRNASLRKLQAMLKEKLEASKNKKKGDVKRPALTPLNDNRV